MAYDAACTIARLLQRLGHWDEALTVLAEAHGPVAGVRAEILVDRFFWRLDQAEPAREAVAALESDDPALAAFLAAQLAYTRLVFDLDPEPDDRTRAHALPAGPEADELLQAASLTARELQLTWLLRAL